MDERTLLWVLVAACVIWMIELVWLFWSSENQQGDPFRTVSGAAVFFVAAAPVAAAFPHLVDRVGDFWGDLVDRVVPDGSHRPSSSRPTARLLINGESRPLTMPRVRLGRYPNNEIVLDHSTVSAYHAEIIQRPDGRHEIVDRESRNGTRVNGALIRSQVLRDGDLITLGAASLHYLSAGPVQTRSGVPAEYDEYPEYDERDPQSQYTDVDEYPAAR